MFTREHAGWPRTIQNSCFIHLTAMERKTYIVLKLSFFSQQSKDRARLFGSSKVPGNVSPAKPTQIQLVQNPVSISHHHTLHPASPDSLSLLRERSRTQAMPASLHLKGKVAKKKILNELLWVPLHFHQYKQVATVNEFLYWNNNSKTLCLKNTAYLPTKQQSYFTELIFRIHCVRSLMVCYIFPHFKYLEN